MARTCLHCGKPISGSPKRLYCSSACRYARLNRVRIIQRQEVRRVSELCFSPLDDPWAGGRLKPSVTANALRDDWA